MSRKIPSRMLAHLLLLAFLSCFSAAPAWSSPPDFGASRLLTVEQIDGTLGPAAPGRVAGLADFDGDGQDDLLVYVTGTDSRLGVFLGRDHAPYLERPTIALPPINESSGGIRVADFDADGQLDVVAIIQDPAHVLVVRGAGDGTFESIREFPAAPATEFARAEVTDVDRDGYPDVLLLDWDGTWWLRNQGGHRLGPPVAIGEEARYPAQGVGDLNSDGVADVIRVPNDFATRDTGEVILSDGRGGFQAARAFELGSPDDWFPKRILVADFNVDGCADIIRTTHEGIVVHEGDGRGAFTRVRLFPIEFFFFYDILPGDLDRDGHLDFLVGRRTRYEAWIGNGHGGYRRRFTDIPTLDPPNPSLSETLVDVDRDGFLDLIAQRDVRYLPGLPRGDFLREGGRRTDSKVQLVPYPAATADFDEDGVVDLVGMVVDESARTLRVFSGDGAGGFADGQRQGDYPYSPAAIEVADFDNDGHADVAVLGVTIFPAIRYYIQIAYGDGTGSLEPPVEVARGNEKPDSLCVADFEQDGIPELIVDHGTGMTLHRRETRERYPRRLDLPGESPVVLDFDGDGQLDLIRPERALERLAVHLGDPGGLIPVTADFYEKLEFIPGRMLGLDFDGDGRDDLAIGDSTDPGRIRFRMGATDQWISSLFRPAIPLLVAEMDGRQGDDLVASGNLILTWDRRTEGPRMDGAYDTTQILGIADVDQDGRGDLIGYTGENTLRVLHNRASDVDCRAGNVDAGSGGAGPVDVLFVNDDAGSGLSRLITLGEEDRVTIRMNAPPAAKGPAPFALYLWHGFPDSTTVEPLPAELGSTCLPIAWTRGARQPAVVWNNLGREPRLGRPSKASTPAPSVVLDREKIGIGVGGNLFLQGVIVDPGSPSGQAAVTNGIAVRIR